MSSLHVREDVPFVQTDAEGNIIAVSDYKNGVPGSNYINTILNGTIAAPSEIATHSEGTFPGSLSGTENYDLIAVELTAGTTYSFAYRGTPTDGIEDPYLALFGPTFGYITEDDDGGYGRTSMITFTPTESGTHYLYATSWYTLAGYGPAADTGNYTIDLWTADPAHDAPGTFEGAVVIDVGTTFGQIDVAGDTDMYAIEMTEGMVYAFSYSGGVSGAADFDGEPGENIAYLDLFDANGNLITWSLNYETGLSYFAEQSGTYYVQVSPYDAYGEEPPEMTGGYTLDVAELNPSDFDPIESLNWDRASNVSFVDVDGVPTAYVYFAPAGENFGELADDGVTPMTTYGWNQTEIDAVMLALEQYEQILGVNYEITTDSEQATFRLLTTTSTQYGAYFYPQDPIYGDAQGIGVFNVNSGGWDKPGVSSQDIPGDQVSLQQGGFAFAVILHEFGHAHGIAHPHDTGGGSEIMLGVTASQGSYGVYDLNQGVYTVMSYNDAWDLHPDGPSSFTIAGIDNGWSGTLSAFDIAVLQDRYGVHDYNTGDNVYSLTDVADDAFYRTIWDSDGNDTIAYDGSLDAHIDLTAATLDYSPTGGGVPSFLYNIPGTPSSQQVKGGFTIANGVVIENATGGSGNDVLIGNSANNVLTGNDGNDTLMGRGGNDRLIAGAGDDTVHGGDGLDVISLGAGSDVFVAEIGVSKVNLKGPNKGAMPVDIITDFDADGDDLIDLSGLGSFTFGGTDANKKAGDLTYKTFDSVNGAEKALGIDIDGHEGAGGIAGPVTVVYGNVDGGAPDFAVILLNTTGVSEDDFIFAESSSAAMVSKTSTGSVNGKRHSELGDSVDSLFQPLGLSDNSFGSGSLGGHDHYIM